MPFCALQAPTKTAWQLSRAPHVSSSASVQDQTNIVSTWNLKIQKEAVPLLTFPGEGNDICLIPPTAIVARSDPAEERM